MIAIDSNIMHVKQCKNYQKSWAGLSQL